MWRYITTFVVGNYHMLNLHSKRRRRLLWYYFTNPTARHHMRDLAQRLDVDPSNLSKELRHLESEGLFTSETNGRQKCFRLNRKYPLFDEVRRIVEKTVGTAPLLAETLLRIPWWGAERQAGGLMISRKNHTLNQDCQFAQDAPVWIRTLEPSDNQSNACVAIT